MNKRINPNLLKLAELTHNPELKIDESVLEEKADKEIQIQANISPQDFIQTNIIGINGNKVLISKFEFPGLNKLKWEETHFKLNESELYMPTPEIFMQHFRNVVDSYNGGTKLYDGLGNLLSENDKEDIYRHLTKDHIAAYKNEGGYQKGALTWLNARFVQGNGFNNLDLETVIGVKNGKLITRREPLEECVREECYVDLKFNKQGLAVEKSQNQEYRQGKNIRFLYPIDGRVAGFNANSIGAVLCCYRNPEYSDSSLGVFACVEGTPRKT